MNTEQSSSRNLGMSIELAEGTGPILAMCSVGDVLEVYKADRCFEIQTPQIIDPNEIDPNAPWIVKHVSEYGSSNEIVARVFLQATTITDEVVFRDTVDKDTVRVAARHCRDNLLECDKLSKRITVEENEVIEKHRSLEVQGNVITSFPRFDGLRETAGAFLLYAKQCVQSAAEIFNAYFSTPFHGPHFQKIKNWCKKNLGDCVLTEFLSDNEPKIKWLVDLRNLFEHPGNKKTEIRDFYWEPDTRSIHVPTWNITGENPTSISKDTAAIATFLTDFVEALIILSAVEASDRFPYRIVKRQLVNSEMPIRYSIEIDPNFLSRPKNE